MHTEILSGPVPAELEVLLSAISGGHTRHSPRGATLDDLVAQPCDWQRLVLLANRHRVVPLLYQGLRDQCWASVPAAVQQVLQRNFTANLKRNFRLTYHAAELLRELAASRTRVVPFKGVFLAQSAYGQLSSRQVNDIDLIIDHEDRLVASQVLESLGYCSVTQLDQQEVFHNLRTQTEVDLHWDITPEFFPIAFDFQQFFDRTQTRTLAEISFNDLSLQDQLLLLSVQLAKDCWERRQKVVHLQKLCDIAHVIDLMDETDLEQVLKHAEAQALNTVMNFSLALVNGLLGLTIPVAIHQRLNADTRALKLAQTAASLSALAATDLPPEGNSLLDLRLRWRQLWFYMGLRKSWKHRRLYLSSIVKTIGSKDLQKRGQRKNEQQELEEIRSDQALVAAATDPTENAVREWAHWLTDNDLDDVDAESYWILPTVHKNLSSHGYRGPEHRRLAGVYKQMRLSNSTLESALTELLASFHARNCEVIIPPPASLALAGTSTTLPLKPLPLIVRTEQVALADELLRHAGWQSSRQIPPAELRAFVRSIDYTHSVRGGIELCWHPLGLALSLASEASLWESSRFGAGPLATARRLSPLDEALIIALNCSRIQKAFLYPLLAIDWRELQDRAAFLGLNPDTIRSGIEGNPDEQARPGALLNRHRKRYRSCPDDCKPASFAGYLRRYYSWSWQSEGLLHGFIRAVGRRLPG